MAYRQNKSPLRQSIMGNILSTASAAASQPKSIAGGIVNNNVPNTPQVQNWFDPILSTPAQIANMANANAGIKAPGTPSGNSIAQTQVNNAMANAVKVKPNIINNPNQTVAPQATKSMMQSVQPTIQEAQAPIVRSNEIMASPINPNLFSNMDTISKLNENTTFWQDRYKDSF
jgi:hypothetical protein